MTADVQDLMIPGPAGRLSVRAKGLAARPSQVVVLVQGANMTGQMGYDFAFPGGDDYSFLDALVAAGFGAVTFSIRGYGRSEAPADPFMVQTEQAIEDLASVMDWTQAQGWDRPHLLGWSWGGRIVGRYAGAHPRRVDRLVLLDPALGGGNKILPAPTAEEAWWPNTHPYFFEKLEAPFTDIRARDALGRRMACEEPRSPNGIRLENANGSVPTDPTRITAPTLMLYGVAAGNQNYMQGGWDRLEFFRQLPTADKQFVILPQGGDYAHLQEARHRVFRSTIDFLRA
jgi:pimeloyl-ACP methyl ester carboxylesterase